MNAKETWITLRLGQNAVDALIEEEHAALVKWREAKAKREKLEESLNLAFDMAMREGMR